MAMMAGVEESYFYIVKSVARVVLKEGGLTSLKILDLTGSLVVLHQNMIYMVKA